MASTAWVCTTDPFRGFSRTMASWQCEPNLPDGAILRSKATGECRKFNAADLSFVPCDYVAPGASQVVDIFPGHHKATHGLARSASKVG